MASAAGITSYKYSLFLYFYCFISFLLGRPDSVVIIEASYELDDPGFESRQEREISFLKAPRPTLGPPSLLLNGYRVSFQ
jgi:hypothetical protein